MKPKFQKQDLVKVKWLDGTETVARIVDIRRYRGTAYFDYIVRGSWTRGTATIGEQLLEPLPEEVKPLWDLRLSKEP